MKEQNKPEWIRDLSLLNKADTDRTVVLFDTGETCDYNYGTWPFAKVVAFYERPLSERTFTESEVISMLEALRQRCAEEAKVECWDFDKHKVDKDSILEVEYKDLIK